MSLAIIGPTRTGKTCWARSLGPHVYWNGQTKFDHSAFGTSSYLVADDIEWEYFKCKKQLLGGQREFQCTEKYTRILKVKFGKPVIYLCNTDPRNNMSEHEEQYFSENVTYFF